MQKKLSIILVVIVFGAILIFANSKGYLAGAFETTKVIGAPISLFFTQLSGGTSGFFTNLFNLGKLQRDNAELRDTVNKLQAEVAQLSEAKKENEQLRTDLGFVRDNKYQYEPSDVISFDPSNLRGMLSINRGSVHGIKSGMAVISNGFMVGKISEVSDKTSKVQLITDPTSAIPVTLKSANTNGLAKGGIGFGLTMEKIPQGEQINQGDTVITSGLGGEIPKGLILGIIEKITRQENSLFIDAVVRPSAELGNLSRLIVIKS
jgi:rod shape-determining protein MreC